MLLLEPTEERNGRRRAKERGEGPRKNVAAPPSFIIATKMAMILIACGKTSPDPFGNFTFR